MSIDYVILGLCIGVGWLLLLLLSFPFIPFHFVIFSMSIHFVSFPFISYLLCDYISTSASPNLYLLPLY